MSTKPVVLVQSASPEKTVSMDVIEEEFWPTVPRSNHSANTVNPIRKICDAMAVPPNPDKKMIKLHLGDPTLTGKLPPCQAVTNALINAVTSHKYDGYGPSVGDPEARQAIVDRYSNKKAPFTIDEVILASGASHALQMAIEAIAGPGDNILIPHPGFPLYATLCRPHAIEDRGYRLNMDEGAIIDIQHMESLIDERTKAIIINNPSNPTGAVFPKQHLEELAVIINKHKLVVIADEIYGDLTYGGASFHPMADISPKVPTITIDGIAKRWLVPGWRLGWCIIHDRYNALKDVKHGMVALSQKIVGPCALVQGALPSILKDTPEEFFQNSKNVIGDNADIVFEALSKVKGLKPVKPYGAMYMMVGIDKARYGEETAFVQGLIQEQSVFCLPGSAFSAPNWFRVVLTYPQDVTQEACERIIEYCATHDSENNNNVVITGVEEEISLLDEGCVLEVESPIVSDSECSRSQSPAEDQGISMQ